MPDADVHLNNWVNDKQGECQAKNLKQSTVDILIKSHYKKVKLVFLG